MEQKNVIKVETLVKAPAAKVWALWTQPAHIMKWTFAASDWHAPYAENDLRVDGTFKTTMAAKDGSMSFDFEGIYSAVEENKLIAYGLGDGRQVKITFEEVDGQTRITEIFDAETQHTIEMQKDGWQAILDNFKQYAEEN